MLSPGRINTRQTSSSQTVTPPIGGLNGRDPLADMSAKDAFTLDNLFPGTARVYSRKGHVQFSSGALAGPVQTLETYTGAAGDQMLAWAGTKMYNASLAAAVELKTGLLNATPITAMFSNAADNAQHMIVVNGQNTPYRYGGAAVADLVLTGVSGSASTLNFVYTFKGRLYFGQRDKLGFYYLPVGQIQGALGFFDLAQVAKLGGYLQAIASFSMGEAGDSPQDYIVFITSKGECIVYAGFDPGVAANWELVGRYYTAQPIGQRCTVNYGTELVIITLDGALPFSEIRRAGDSKSQSANAGTYQAITAKLGKYLSELNANASIAGWMGIQYTGEDGWLLLNVPITQTISGGYYHYVMNTKTNAWTRFTNWNGLTFTVFNRRLYFGTFAGLIMLADEGRQDNGSSITFDCQQAYNYFEDGSGIGALQKHFQWASLLVSCDGVPPLSGKYSVDFTEDRPVYVNTPAAPDGTPWDVGFWDTAVWGDDARTQRFIITLNKGGYAGSLWLRCSLDGLTFAWYATQFVMEKTRGLL